MEKLTELPGEGNLHNHSQLPLSPATKHGHRSRIHKLKNQVELEENLVVSKTMKCAKDLPNG